jgi:D-aminopeptidase
MRISHSISSLFLLLSMMNINFSMAQSRPRELGVPFGVLPTGSLNAITDVPGIKVGQLTKIEGQDIRTGVTAILPHGGNLFQEKVPAAIFVGNGFGKLAGVTQEIESTFAWTRPSGRDSGLSVRVWKSSTGLPSQPAP